MNREMLIANRYEIQNELGEGGMGTVYLAHDTQTDRPVAIKHLRSELADPRLIERFQREGEALRNLNHPNIVKLLDMLEIDREHYLVMEYISGGDLAQCIKQGTLSIKQIVQYALDLADALVRAHKLNIIHRDLKPANVLIGDDGVLRLADFGVAYLGDEGKVTAPDVVVGTINYLAPEIIQGLSPDNRSDIWSFGLILFEMIAGKPPYQRNGIAQTLYAMMNEPLPDLEIMRLDAPIELVDLVYRMLEHDPQARISSVRHIGAVLEDILHGRTLKEPIDRRFSTVTRTAVKVTRHNLPIQTTPFVGRDSEVETLLQLLNHPDNRLITILAPGGMGKTRLSLAVAERQFDHYTDGVFFVELAPLSKPDDIVNTLAEAMTYQFQGGDISPTQQVLDLLQRKLMLLIFDNFEHLISGASLLDDILKSAPHVKILVTSRQQLSLAGETLFRLSGMEFSTWNTPEDASAYGSVQLFLQSARRVRPEFDLTQDNLQDVASICQLVQGMPLGIILSASWLGMLSTTEVIEEIVGGLDFLETDETILPERQRSIRVVFDYSWESMTPAEQNTFMKLSVFRSGFTRESAQAIAGANLRGLMSLTNKSLIHRDTTTGRYTIHELLRQYAEEKLKSAQLIDDTRQVHATFYTQLSIKAEGELRYANQEHWYRVLEDEHDNIRRALDWSLNHQIADAAHIVIALRDFWFYQGYHKEAYTWGSKVLQQVDGLTPVLKGRVYGSYASFAWILQDLPEATHYFEQSIETLRQTDKKRYLAWALLYIMGVTTSDPNRHQETLDIYTEAMQLFEAVDDRAGIANLHNMAGALHQRMKNYDLAAESFTQCIEWSRRTGETRRVATNTMNLAKIRVIQQQPELGLILLKEASYLLRKIGFRYMQLYILTSYVELLVLLQRYEQALIVGSAYFALSETLGMKIQPWSMDALNRSLDHIKTQLAPTTYQLAQTYGQAMTLEQMNDYTLDIELDG